MSLEADDESLIDDPWTMFGGRFAEGDLRETYTCKNPIVYIFSHDEFTGFEKRPGREEDETRIIEHFGDTLKCHVVDPFVNLTSEEVKSTLAEVSEKDFKEHDGVIVWVISQYNLVGKYLSKDGFYTEDDITKYFKGIIKPELIAMPKVFIFQSSKAKEVLKTQTRRHSIQTDGSRRSHGTFYSLPTDANLFVVRSSLNYLTDEGASWFVKEVCDNLLCRLPLHEEIVNVLRSCQEKIDNEDNERTRTCLPDVTSTMLYKLFLNEIRINVVDHVLEHYDRGEKNGCVFIFNYQEVYNDSKEVFDTRKGTEKDVDRMKETFQRLNFDVFIEHNLSKKELMAKLSEDRGFSKDMCVVVAIFTHGYNGMLGTVDKDIDPSDIVDEINEHDSLEGKPRIFIFQVCRGVSLAQGVRVKGIVEGVSQKEEEEEINQEIETDVRVTHAAVEENIKEEVVSQSGRNLELSLENEEYSSLGYAMASPVSTPSSESSSGFPRTNPTLKTKDTLILHSAYTGSAAVRDKYNGTWLIQELCSEINRQTPNTITASLTDIITGVQRNVALKTHGNKKQMPVYTSTLTKKLIIGRRILNNYC